MRLKSLLLCIFALSAFASKAQEDSLQKASALSELSLEELMNVKVVTASGSEQTLTEAPSTMMVITGEQITERGYEQLEDVLRDIPGVDLIHTYGQAATFITFRGMYGDENKRLLLMVDGIVENSLIGGYEIAGPAYSLHHVERIEIIWGPASALYGANAFTAVINILTKKGSETNKLKYQAGYGSFNTWIHNLSAGGKKNIKNGAVDFAVSGSLFNTSGPRFSNQHHRYSNAYVDDAWSVNAKLSYSIKNIITTLGYRTYTTPRGFGAITTSPTVLLGLPPAGNLNKGIGGVMPADFNGERPSLAESYARTAFIESEISTGSKFKIFARLQSRSTGLSTNSYAYGNFPGTSIFSRDILAYSANRVKGELSANYDFIPNHKISFGVQFSRDNLERGNRGVVPDTRVDSIEGFAVRNLRASFAPRAYTIQRNLGTFIQYVHHSNFLKNSDFTIGARFDDNNIYGSTFNPRLGFINQPIDGLTIKLMYGSAFRAPTNFELYSLTANRIANPNLKPEKIHTVETNFIYVFKKTLLMQANFFSNSLKEVIIQGVPIGNNTFQNQNTGTASVYGVETKLDFAPTKSLSGFLNFTYQKGTQNDGIKKSGIPNIARVKGNLGATLNIAKAGTICIIQNVVGKRSVPLSNPLGSVKGYTSTNLVITTGKLFDRVTASLNIRNLFDQTYYDPGIRAADGNFFPTVVDQPGINGLLKIAVSLF